MAKYDLQEEIRRVEAWADDKKLTPGQRAGLAYFCDTIRTPHLFTGDDGYVDMDRVYDGYRASNPATQGDFEREVHSRVSARKRLLLPHGTAAKA